MSDRLPPQVLPFMVDKTTAAALCSMSVATYDKFAKQKLLPQMNATGRVSIEAIRRAAFKLDGIATVVESKDAADAALSAWESEYENRNAGH